MVPMVYFYFIFAAMLVVLSFHAKENHGIGTDDMNMRMDEGRYSLLNSSTGQNGDQSRSNRQLQTLLVVGQVEALRLINANTDLPITDLVDGMIINVAMQCKTISIYKPRRV
jgi:hypothetical protein